MSKAVASEEKAAGVKCKASVSFLPNNLTGNPASIAYIHKNELYLLENKGSVFQSERYEPTKAAYTEKDAISQVRWCRLAMGEVLVLVSTGGLVHVYTDNGRSLYHAHKLQKSQVALSAKDALLRGIAHDGNSTLFIGTGSGEILVFQLTAKKLTLLKKLEGGHEEPISDLVHSASGSASSNLSSGLLISGDEAGILSYWSNVDEEYKKVGEWKNSAGHYPILSLGMGHGLFLAADSTGHVRIFDAEKRTLKAELAAHARAINAIDVHPTRPIFVAAGEDSWVSIWSLPTSKSSSIKSLAAQSPVSSLLTGVRFAGTDSNTIVVTAYDSRYIFSFPAPQ